MASLPQLWSTALTVIVYSGGREALQYAVDPRPCHRGQVRVTPHLPRGACDPAKCARHTMLPWFCGLQSDLKTLAPRDIVATHISPSGLAIATGPSRLLFCRGGVGRPRRSFRRSRLSSAPRQVRGGEEAPLDGVRRPKWTRIYSYRKGNGLAYLVGALPRVGHCINTEV